MRPSISIRSSLIAMRICYAHWHSNSCSLTGSNWRLWGKALRDLDVASGVLLVKVAERRATLLGLNAPQGHAVRVVQHPPEHHETSTDRIERALDALITDQRRSQNGQGEPH
jgi:hypothetical protein